MRGLLAVLVVAALVALTTSAEAQQGAISNSNLNRTNDRPGGAPPPQEAPKKRVNEKDYKSSLERLPDQKFDPWAKTR